MVERTRKRNRLRALTASAEQLAAVVNGIAVNIRRLERRIALITAPAVALITAQRDETTAEDSMRGGDLNPTWRLPAARLVRARRSA